MPLIFTINEVSSDEWIKLRKKTGFPAFDEEIADAALLNSVAVIGVKLEECGHIGMLRIIGDKAYAFYFNDVIIDPEFQGLGIGTRLINFAIEFVKNQFCIDTLFSISVFVNIEAQLFYRKIGFTNVDEVPMKIHVKCGIRGTRQECLRSE